MIQRDGERMSVSGAVTLGNVAALLEEGRRLLGEGVRTVDLGGVGELDSALLALLFAWVREAKSRGHELAFANLPKAAGTIAKLYGVQSLLPVAAR